MNITISDAVSSIDPTTNFSVDNNKIIAWDISETPTNNIQPTEAEIDAEIARLQTSYDALAYSRKREAEYPSVQECVHAILDDTLDALQAKRAEIKTKFPKG